MTWGNDSQQQKQLMSQLNFQLVHSKSNSKAVSDWGKWFTRRTIATEPVKLSIGLQSELTAKQPTKL